MKKQYYNVVGVMSGTSLDGIDLVNVQFEKKSDWEFSVIHSETIPYNGLLKKKLKNAIHLQSDSLKKLDEEYTKYLTEVILAFISKYKIIDIDFIASHGHTVFHEPEKGVTYQIGNMPFMAKKLNKTVVCDFRVEDVELGGQGAPLVPIGDKLLFPEYDFCLNIGGFANVTTEEQGVYKAFDICAANNVLNHYVAKLGLEYDDRGKIAASGTLNQKLFAQLNSLPYYSKKPPKSLGIEWVESEIIPIIDHYPLNIEGILRTYTEHIAQQISMVLTSKSTVLITGGGAYNDFLIKRLRQISRANIILPDKAIIEFKEAIIFGLLGVLRTRNEINCLKSITGAHRDHSSGKIYIP
ncbi:anhydro-N-acetylmuramic acid kinase [Galbibacter sp. PAP.153]|uniref:anhydro-N-acetylmuramic acid kinase n=1 Tax=Galbibacter sp. PAP.153 TaxID=3104623 RepID=UPI00300997B3